MVTNNDTLFEHGSIIPYNKKLANRLLMAISITYDSTGLIHGTVHYKKGEIDYFHHGRLVKREYPRKNNSDGFKRYVYYNDNLQPHKDNEPAMIDWDGTQSYYERGKRHRADGPQVCDPNGNGDIYFYKGKRVDKEFIDRKIISSKLDLI